MHTHPTRTLLLLFTLLLVVSFIVYAWSTFSSVPAPTGTNQAITFPADAPVPTEADYVTAQKGFQYLVSYNGDAFIPAELSVKKGETVRFTNNGTGSVQVSVADAASPSLAHGRYFEYTFTKVGTFSYSDGTHTGSVTVK